METTPALLVPPVVSLAGVAVHSHLSFPVQVALTVIALHAVLSSATDGSVAAFSSHVPESVVPPPLSPPPEDAGAAHAVPVAAQ